MKKLLSGLILFCLACGFVPLMLMMLLLKITGIARLAAWAMDQQEEK